MSRRVFAVVLFSTVFMLILNVGSRAPWHPGDDEHAILRLSWRVRPEHIERCRDRTQTELAALPAHMRTPRICETRAVPYRLVVVIDGSLPDTTIVLPAGAKHDRPIYVLRDRRLTPGTHHVAVTFGRADRNNDAVSRFDAELLLIAGYIELITMVANPKRLAHLSTQQ